MESKRRKLTVKSQQAWKTTSNPRWEGTEALPIPWFYSGETLSRETSQHGWIWLVSMRMWVRSLASLSSLRIWRCHKLWCRSKTGLRSHIAVVVGQAGNASADSTLGLGTSICPGYGPKKQKKKKRDLWSAWTLDGSVNIQGRGDEKHIDEYVY